MIEQIFYWTGVVAALIVTVAFGFWNIVRCGAIAGDFTDESSELATGANMAIHVLLAFACLPSAIFLLKAAIDNAP